MKLRDKSAALLFTVHNLDTGRTLHIHPVRNNHLSERQFDSMSGRPDMFYQYVQLLKRKMRSRGLRNYTINAQYFVSVNGRAHQEMVDPKLDLRTIRYSPFTHSDWIKPLAKNLPPGEYKRFRLLPPFSKKSFKSFKKPDGDW